ncbi:hypothetical protein WJ0W_006525 [Paenibacillus melissococcoides]|uniref:Uncharacterized protein n=1 Tax=Paenibacillus melissococcoides TaxID=2912268 RepID=A0ABN8UDR3_9BACL|nr:hypothetical protein [Paenibacillus melissococcoides]CAH8249339.1 hypothetical protein WJ0W_006525 [Paenibacillus melissococcoides]
MSALKDVTVTIDLVQPIGRLGFGTPLIYGAKAKGHDFKYYYELDAVLKDFQETSRNIWPQSRSLLRVTSGRIKSQLHAEIRQTKKNSILQTTSPSCSIKIGIF